MRKIAASRTSSLSQLSWRRSIPLGSTHLITHRDTNSPPTSSIPRRTLAQVRPEPLGELWFTSSAPHHCPHILLSTTSRPNPNQTDHKPPSKRTLLLGKTLRTLSPLLPNILSTPLPPDLLSPSVTLHLFPSTHPHLPIVKGRVPYRAALWTAPVAWGCVPLVGNTRIKILSEKIVRTGYLGTPVDEENDLDLGDEKLVVRWKTEARASNNTTTTSSPTPTSAETTSQPINRNLSTLLGGDRPLFPITSTQSSTPSSSSSSKSEFTGLFIFTFTRTGQIATHTIEHADENNGFDKTSKVVTVADWLLGKAKRRKEEEGMIPGLAAEGVREEWRFKMGRERGGGRR